MYYAENSIELTNKSTQDLNDDLLFIRVEMVDGSSQTLQISKQQAIDLGIELTDGPPEICGHESVPKEDISNITTQVIIDGDKYLEEEKIIVDNNGKVTEYRILHPLELNLKPLKKKDFLPNRGRCCKRPMDDVITLTPLKKARIMRTRSGRVTAPPKHIQQIYKKFVDTNHIKAGDCDIARAHSPILIGDFAPLRTNGTPPPAPAVKSMRASQFRCTTCNKAYIGKRKMRKHLKTCPDHAPKRIVAVADTKAWDCLVDTAKMARDGKRGAKFCRELLNLLTNARILARYFFKLRDKVGDCNGGEDTGRYLMGELLAHALGMENGWYSFNENELCKDVSIFSFLENFDSDVLSALSINDVTNCQLIDNNVHIQANVINQRNINLSTHKSDKIIINENNLKNTEKHGNASTNFYNKNKNEEILSDNIINSSVKSDDKNCPDIVNLALETSSFVIGEKIDKKSTNISPHDVPATILDNTNHLGDGINLSQLNYGIGESLDVPPLEIFQFDSNQ